MGSEQQSIRVPDDISSGMRLDLFLSSQFREYSRSFLAKLINDGMVSVDGENRRCSWIVRPGNQIEIAFPEQNKLAQPEDIELDVLYEDEDLVVVNKQPGLVVHPGNGNADGTLVNAMLHYVNTAEFEDMNDEEARPGIVHRLDKDTSGALIVAKNQKTADAMKASFAKQAVRKTYLAIVDGKLAQSSGSIELPIGRHPAIRTKWAIVREHGKFAWTEYTLVAYSSKYNVSLVKIRLHTGRTHQIRVHFSAFGNPVLGDRLYGHAHAGLPCDVPRQMLHAWRIAFEHPTDGRPVRITAPLSSDFLNVLDCLELPHPPEAGRKS